MIPKENYKSHLKNLSIENFIANPTALIYDFANYLQDKHNHRKMQSGSSKTTLQEQNQPIALINHLTNFLTETDINAS